MIVYSMGFNRHNKGTYDTTTVAILERDADTRKVLRTHSRPGYTGMEAVQTAAWLNDRAQGYEVPDNLQHLYNGH